jgi:hypothetical protein
MSYVINTRMNSTMSASLSVTLACLWLVHCKQSIILIEYIVIYGHRQMLVSLIINTI